MLVLDRLVSAGANCLWATLDWWWLSLKCLYIFKAVS